jgi:predicted CXXCH cytochrome family protein
MKVNRKYYVSLILILGLIIFASTLAMAKSNVPAANESCLTCHQRDFSVDHNGKKISLKVDQEAMANSVHKSLPCTTCHTEIEGYPHENPIYGKELTASVSQSCQMCHSNVGEKYKESKHWTMTQAGIDISCSKCHGKHDVQKLELTKQEEVDMCVECHKGDVLEGYEQSFHGKAVLLGSEDSASCIDCHDSHQALSAEKEASLVSDKNRPGTCAKCHTTENPSANFAKGTEHMTLDAEGPGAISYYVYKLYIWLIILVIGFMLVHIIIELYGKFIRAKNNDDH